MLSVNKKDFNVPTIATESKLGNLDTRFEYRVYGLKQEDNPLILVSNPFIDEIEGRLKSLKKFFAKQGLQLKAERDEVRRISIGLRYDLRGHVVLCAAILQTIVYCLEDRLELDQKFVVPGIPKFSDVPEKKVSKKKQEEKPVNQENLDLLSIIKTVENSDSQA